MVPCDHQRFHAGDRTAFIDNAFVLRVDLTRSEVHYSAIVVSFVGGGVHNQKRGCPSCRAAINMLLRLQ